MVPFKTVSPLATPLDLRELTILFAEDDELVRKHVARVLTPICRELLVAENGRIALELFRRHQPDLVLTDITMPAMNGLELAKIIKQERPMVPVITISACNDTEHLLRAINLKIDGYLLKPLNIEQLFFVLQKEAAILRSQRLANQQSRLLSGVNMAIQYLLSSDANQDAVDFALQEMAKAAQADKVCLFSFHAAAFGQREVRLVSGFASGDQVLRVLNGIDPEAPELPYVERWYRMLRQGKSVSGPRTSFPVEERSVLDGLRIRSILMTPIFEEGHLWGFASLYDMQRERAWTDAETSMVMTATRGLGSFMGRLKMEEERVAARRAMEFANVQWRETFDTIPDLVTVIDTAHQIVHINKAARERLGVDGTSLEGVGPCYLQFHGASHPPDSCPHAALLQDQQPHETEVFIPRLDSFFHITVNPTFDAEGSLVGAVHVARDVTKRREMEDRLRYLSTHDELTQLFNRAFFEAELENLRQGRTSPISVVIADLDSLKAVNDQYGHDHGDALIKAAAELLREVFRGGDTIVRLGGDEFAVLLKGVGEELLATIMDRARELLSSGSSCSEHGLPIRFSLGSATTHAPSCLQETIREADLAMYADKKSRKGV
jgi:diguanylate cyclase (GGDEF)-like protein/PAS domain S-box-containing protein